MSALALVESADEMGTAKRAKKVTKKPKRVPSKVPALPEAEKARMPTLREALLATIALRWPHMEIADQTMLEDIADAVDRALVPVDQGIAAAAKWEGGNHGLAVDLIRANEDEARIVWWRLRKAHEAIKPARAKNEAKAINVLFACYECDRLLAYLPVDPDCPSDDALLSELLEHMRRAGPTRLLEMLGSACPMIAAADPRLARHMRDETAKRSLELKILRAVLQVRAGRPTHAKPTRLGASRVGASDSGPYVATGQAVLQAVAAACGVKLDNIRREVNRARTAVKKMPVPRNWDT